MGLDINYYSGLTKLKPLTNEECTGLCFFINIHFNHRADDIDEDYEYAYETRGEFRAGSYSGYNKWRHELAQLVGYAGASYYWETDIEAAPFYNLINFSDCEGTLGTEVCKSLYKDFEDYSSRADEFFDEYSLKIYNKFKEAFRVASDNGAVQFC